MIRRLAAYFLQVWLTENSGELVKMTEEIDSSVVQAVTGDISDNFSDAEQTDGLLLHSVARNRNYLF
jgi:hypothetical protein